MWFGFVFVFNCCFAGVSFGIVSLLAFVELFVLIAIGVGCLLFGIGGYLVGTGCLF